MCLVKYVLLHEPLELKRCEILTSIADSISFGGHICYNGWAICISLSLFMIEILPDFIGNICYISWYSMIGSPCSLYYSGDFNTGAWSVVYSSIGECHCYTHIPYLIKFIVFVTYPATILCVFFLSSFESH